MIETIESIIKWHAETFPDATLAGQLEKYNEEITEWHRSNHQDINELADIVIVACGLARFCTQEAIEAFAFVRTWLNSSKFDRYDLFKAIEAKMAINRNRNWDFKNGKYKHKG